MLEILAFLLVLTSPRHVPLPALAPLSGTSAFQPGERAVGNWRVQAALHLNLSTEDAVGWLTGKMPANLPRCIRLNNYWCIKKAGWAGELGADAEGHVAFGSAAEGASAAVTLLRRYYLVYGRKSARAIVAHWAPTQCGLSVAGSDAQVPAPAISVAPLAKYGMGRTLRARWLATHTPGGFFKAGRRSVKMAVKRSVIPDPLTPMARAPAARMPGIEPSLAAPDPPVQLEPPMKTEKLRLASVPPPRVGEPPRAPPLAPVVTSCPGETARLANYAARVIEGLARSPDEDLKLFDTKGSPLPAVSRLLANMTGVEIGPYRADAKLIAAAIEPLRNPAPLPEKGLGE